MWIHKEAQKEMEINIVVFLTIQLHNVLKRGVLPFDTSSIFLPYYGYFPCVLGHCVQYTYVCMFSLCEHL